MKWLSLHYAYTYNAFCELALTACEMVRNTHLWTRELFVLCSFTLPWFICARFLVFHGLVLPDWKEYITCSEAAVNQDKLAAAVKWSVHYFIRALEQAASVLKEMKRIAEAVDLIESARYNARDKQVLLLYNKLTSDVILGLRPLFVLLVQTRSTVHSMINKMPWKWLKGLSKIL